MRTPYRPHSREQIVYEGIDACSYLPQERMRTPLRYQFDNFTPWAFDDSLSGGDRRVGRMVYRTECPSCKACEPIRIPVQQFSRSKSQRRIFNKNQDLRVMMSPAKFSSERLALFNRHKLERGLSNNERPYRRDQYERWLIESCTDTREFQYYLNDDLIGVSILDFGAFDISSVYFYFDPNHTDRSLGTFSALFEMEWMKQQSMRFYYLGLYVSTCSHLSYKSRYYPHHRLIDNQWRVFVDRRTVLADTVVVDDMGGPVP